MPYDHGMVPPWALKIPMSVARSAESRGVCRAQCLEKPSIFQDKIWEISWSKAKQEASKRYLFDLSLTRGLTSFCYVVEEEQGEELGGHHRHLY